MSPEFISPFLTFQIISALIYLELPLWHFWLLSQIKNSKGTVPLFQNIPSFALLLWYHYWYCQIADASGPKRSSALPSQSSPAVVLQPSLSLPWAERALGPSSPAGSVGGNQIAFRAKLIASLGANGSDSSGLLPCTYRPLMNLLQRTGEAPTLEKGCRKFLWIMSIRKCRGEFTVLWGEVCAVGAHCSRAQWRKTSKVLFDMPSSLASGILLNGAIPDAGVCGGMV